MSFCLWFPRRGLGLRHGGSLCLCRGARWVWSCVWLGLTFLLPVRGRHLGGRLVLLLFCGILFFSCLFF